MARCSDLVALVPLSCLDADASGEQAAAGGIRHFELPVPTPDIAISAMWHPCMDKDPVHHWLQETIMSVCRTTFRRHRPDDASRWYPLLAGPNAPPRVAGQATTFTGSGEVRSAFVWNGLGKQIARTGRQAKSEVIRVRRLL